MKKSLILAGMSVLACLSSFAQTGQENAEKGLFLGVDNDSMGYLVGSPADNWFIAAGAGVQTYIANEAESSARWNPVTPSLYVEVGKWVLPDLAVSFNVSGFNSVSHTRYSRNPFTDYTGVANTTGTLPYHQTQFLNFAFNAGIIFDWTNFFCGYEKGSSHKLHILTPVGLGLAWVNGQNSNKLPDLAGKTSNNFELDFYAAVIPEIALGENVHLVPALRFQMQRGSLDYSGRDMDSAPYSQNCRFDFQPSATIGVRFNLSGVKKGGASHKKSDGSVVSTNHVFIPVNGSQAYSVIKNDYDALMAETAGLKGALDASKAEAAALTAANAALAAKAADAAALAAGAKGRELTPMEEILLGTDTEGLKSVKVFFQNNSNVIDATDDAKLKEFAQFIKNSGENAKFYIAGAADAATGSEKKNYDLSVSRAKAVYNTLVKKYGVYPGKLELRPLGGIAEYGDIDLNRVGIVVEASDVMTQVFDKYSKKY